MAVTLEQLKTRSRQRADMENSDFVEEAELVDYINASLAELYDLLVAAYGEEYFLANPHTVNTVSNVTDYDLPADFYKLKGLDAKVGTTEWISLRQYNFNERNRLPDTSFLAPNLRYRIMGSKIKLSPVPTGVFTLRAWYVPVAPTLTLDADTFNDVNGFSEYVIVDTAIKMLQKEESDVSVLMAQKDRLKRRLEEMANNRDAGQPESVTDIYADNSDYWPWRS